MKPIATLALLVVMIVWVNTASPQPANLDRVLLVRIIGTLLPADAQEREDLVTVKIFLQGQLRLLRVGQVEDLTASEREQAVKEDILLQEVRFYGPDALLSQLQNPQMVGKVLTIEGRLDLNERRFLVTSVKGPADKGPQNRE